MQISQFWRRGGGPVHDILSRPVAVLDFLSCRAWQGIMPGMDGRSESTELRRGVLGPCVLALLAERPRFGLELVRDLSKADGLLTSEGTVYPLLNPAPG
jgi:hypothetical protein